jgi:hypothetical protein
MEPNHLKTCIAFLVVAGLAALVVVPALATPPSGVTNPPWRPVIGRFDGIHTAAKSDIEAGSAPVRPCLRGRPLRPVPGSDGSRAVAIT